MIVFVSTLNFLLKRELKKIKINATKAEKGISMVFLEKEHKNNY